MCLQGGRGGAWEAQCTWEGHKLCACYFRSPPSTCPLLFRPFSGTHIHTHPHLPSSPHPPTPTQLPTLTSISLPSHPCPPAPRHLHVVIPTSSPPRPFTLPALLSPPHPPFDPHPAHLCPPFDLHPPPLDPSSPSAPPSPPLPSSPSPSPPTHLRLATSLNAPTWTCGPRCWTRTTSPGACSLTRYLPACGCLLIDQVLACVRVAHTCTDSLQR